MCKVYSTLYYTILEADVCLETVFSEGSGDGNHLGKDYFKTGIFFFVSVKDFKTCVNK